MVQRLVRCVLAPRAATAAPTPDRPRRGGARPAVAPWLVLLALALAALGTGPRALAQASTPVLALNTNLLAVGDNITLEGRDLRPDAPYKLTLTGPDGTVLTMESSADTQGNLRFSRALDSAGRWSLALTGPGIDATFWVEVTAPEGSASGGNATPPDASATPAAPLPDSPPTSHDGGGSAGAGASDGAATAPSGPSTGAPSSDGTPPAAAAPGGQDGGIGATGSGTAGSGTAGSGTAGSSTNGSSTNGSSTNGSSTDGSSSNGSSSTDSGGPVAGTTGGTPPAAGAPTPSPASPTPPAPGADATPSGTPPASAAPAPAAPAGSAAALDLSFEGTTLVAKAGGAERWRLAFPADSGDSGGAVQRGDAVYLGHGNSLLVIGAADGVVRDRFALPAQVAQVALDGDAVAVTVAFSGGETQRLLWAPGGLSDTVRFGTDRAMFDWLRHEADVADPQARLTQDPTNPWLYVRAAEQAGSPDAATAAYRSALQRATTFYDRAALARVLLRANEPDLANEAMDGALRDFVARGYRAELLTEPALREAYGFPLAPLQDALTRGDLTAAGFWAPWVYRLSTPEVPATQQALGAYARALRDAGRRDEASLWRSRAREGAGFQLGRSLAGAARTLGRAGWYGVVALLIAIVALHLTLMAKYWRPQSLMLKQRVEAGRSAGPVPRLYAMRYYSLTEKLVLVLMFAAVLALAALASWSSRGADLPTSWRSGTLASTPARSTLDARLDDTPTASFVRGYAAQMAGDRAAAAEAYRAAGDLAPALTNLGVLEGDDALLQRALDVAGRAPVASYDLGRGTDPSPLHAATTPDAPLLVTPTETMLAAAVAGSFQSALGAAFRNPWAALLDARVAAIPAWLWAAMVVLVLAWAAITVIWLVIPRPRLAANAPRTLAYHVLALVLPGSGLADELWGVLLLIPWAIFGLDTLLHFLPGGPSPAIALQTDYAALGILYALNVVSFVVEYVSYRRRMRDLRRDHPETARAYGMRTTQTPSAG